jgi:L-asparaginase
VSATSQLVLIAMGGTIDKDYVVETASLEVADPFISSIKPLLRLASELQIVQLARKDSLELDDADRARLVAYIVKHGCRRFVITHGTDTLLATATAVAHARGAGTIHDEVTAVLTGAFRPGRFAPAEASFNLGFALAVAQTAPAGVYVAMGGRYDTVEHVTHADARFTYD